MELSSSKEILSLPSKLESRNFSIDASHRFEPNFSRLTIDGSEKSIDSMNVIEQGMVGHVDNRRDLHTEAIKPDDCWRSNLGSCGNLSEESEDSIECLPLPCHRIESFESEPVHGNCALCQSAFDEIRLGKKYQSGKVMVHLNCLVFARGLVANGRKGEGILGYLERDIMSVVDRAKRLKCTFCGKDGAASACYKDDCPAVFHYPCGLANNVLSQHEDNRYVNFL